MEKSPRLTWATQVLTVEYNGAYSPNVSVRRMAWIFLDVLPCRGKNIVDSSGLHYVDIARVAW